MRVFVNSVDYPSTPGGWETYLFFGQQIQFDPKSKADEKLFDAVLKRDDINEKCGTVIGADTGLDISRCDTSLDIPRCKKCGAHPVRYYYNLGFVYGVVCPVCGTPTPDLPVNLK